MGLGIGTRRSGFDRRVYLYGCLALHSGTRINHILLAWTMWLQTSRYSRVMICQLDETGRGLVRAAMQQLQMSMRAFHRILKLARTIADLAGSERIETAHLAEAIQYRPRRMV